jgi:hypothetical protein
MPFVFRGSQIRKLVFPHVPRIALLVLLGLVFVVGCGGKAISQNPCSNDFRQANPAYAGNYSGLFEKSSTGTTPRNLDFTLALDASGNLTGSVIEAQTGRSAVVSGQILDWILPCAEDETLVDLQFTFPNDQPRELIGSRPKRDVQPWPFHVEYWLGNSNIADGMLTLAKL